MSAQSNLEAVWQAFINRWFTKAQLQKLCAKKGVKVKGGKETFTIKTIELYSPKELAAASKVIQQLDWVGKLVLSILLSGPRTKQEMLENEVFQEVLSSGTLEAALALDIFRTIPGEAKRYLGRRISYLKKNHMLLLKRKGGKWIYSIHPWILPHLKANLTPPSKEEILKQLEEEKRRVREAFRKEFPSYAFKVTWKENLRKFEGLISELVERAEMEISELRFGLPALAVSSIAQQYFCEKKVELIQRYGKEEAPEMMLGREAHEKLLEDSVKAKRDEIWKKIATGLPVGVREMPLLGRFKDTIIAGIADGVYFYNTMPILLLEHKFTRYRYPFSEYHVQASLYCFLLHLMGFYTKRLKYALVLAPHQCKEREELRKIVKRILAHPEKDMLQEEISDMTIRIYIVDFDIDRTKENLYWALGFWKKEREAIPTRKAGKCAACEFKQVCPSFVAS